jgi:hypothetical protein
MRSGVVKLIRTTVLVIGLLAVILGLTLYLRLKPTFLYSSISPDNKFKILIYERPRFFSMPGDGSTRCAFIELYDRNGSLLEKTEEDCPVFTNDIEIVWKKDYVFFAGGSGFELPGD